LKPRSATSFSYLPKCQLHIVDLKSTPNLLRHHDPHPMCQFLRKIEYKEPPFPNWSECTNFQKMQVSLESQIFTNHNKELVATRLQLLKMAVQHQSAKLEGTPRTNRFQIKLELCAQGEVIARSKVNVKDLQD